MKKKLDLPNIKKILIVQTAFLGDTILATSILEKINLYYPQVKIDFLIREGNETLFENHPFLHKLFIWNKQKKKYRNLFILLKEIRAQKYSVLVNVQRHSSTALLSLFSRSNYTIGFDANFFSFFFKKKIPYKSYVLKKHEIEKNHQLIEAFTDEIPHLPKIYIQNKHRYNIKKYQKGEYICISPASIWQTKQLPLQKWIDFIDAISSSVSNIYLLGSKDDSELCMKIVEQLNNVTSLAGVLSLLESAALMEKALISFTNDSAAAHLATAIQSPVCTLYCSTIPQFGFTPLSPFTKIIEIDYQLNCRPCGSHGKKKCPLQHFRCGNDIKIEKMVEVFHQIKKKNEY